MIDLPSEETNAGPKPNELGQPPHPPSPGTSLQRIEKMHARAQHDALLAFSASFHEQIATIRREHTSATSPTTDPPTGVGAMLTLIREVAAVRDLTKAATRS